LVSFYVDFTDNHQLTPICPAEYLAGATASPASGKASHTQPNHSPAEIERSAGMGNGKEMDDSTTMESDAE
jgi:hypothetical protein